jgi:hypothetical protein
MWCAGVAWYCVIPVCGYVDPTVVIETAHCMRDKGVGSFTAQAAGDAGLVRISMACVVRKPRKAHG